MSFAWAPCSTRTPRQQLEELRPREAPARAAAPLLQAPGSGGLLSACARLTPAENPPRRAAKPLGFVTAVRNEAS